jgi:UDPglucose 6-dehydrogenase
VKVCVLGLWHLGVVTAACLAAAGHDVVGVDEDAERVSALRAGRAPLAEAGLDELVAEGIASGRLDFETDPAAGVRGADVTWVAYDTPVDDDDVADVAWVVERVRAHSAHMPSGSILLVSSQVPVGTTSALGDELSERGIAVAYSPENLRLGHAIEAFTRAERTVVGVDAEDGSGVLNELLSPFAARIEWMSIRSAEMTKHAINAFLATSVAFTNELARLCETSGADAGEVERGLRSEPRIGARAYVHAGTAFAGGTLARDVVFLEELGRAGSRPTQVLSGVRASNTTHQHWPDEMAQRLLGSLSGRVIAVWGLAYKPGTSTLRRSAALELCRRLRSAGADVRAYDPAVAALPNAEGEGLTLADGPVEAAAHADALVVMTPWPMFRDVAASALAAAMRQTIVIDPDAFLAGTLDVAGFRYASVGRAPR